MSQGLIVEVNRDFDAYDILPGSAIVCRAGPDGGPLYNRDGMVEVWFEGNANDTDNLAGFFDKIDCAAVRMILDYPTTAKDAVLAGELVILAEYDLRRRFVTRVIDDAGWRSMLDRPHITYVAPPVPAHDVTDKDVITKALRTVGYRHLRPTTPEITWPWVYQLRDGRVLLQTGREDGQLFWPDDPRILELRNYVAPEDFVRIEPEEDRLAALLKR